MFFLSSYSNKISQEEKIEIIYKQYGTLLYVVAFSILEHKQDAEDAVQETMLALSKIIQALDDRSPQYIKNLAVRITKNNSFNILKKRGQRLSFHVPIEDEECTPSNENLEHEYNLRSDAETVAHIIQSMNPCYQEVLFLYYLYQLKPKQIAELLGRPIHTVKSQLRRGKQFLTKSLKGDSI